MPTKTRRMKDWLKFFNQYGKDLMKAMPASEIREWYGAPFDYWFTHEYRKEVA